MHEIAIAEWQGTINFKERRDVQVVGFWGKREVLIIASGHVRGCTGALEFKSLVHEETRH